MTPMRPAEHIRLYSLPTPGSDRSLAAQLEILVSVVVGYYDGPGRYISDLSKIRNR